MFGSEYVTMYVSSYRSLYSLVSNIEYIIFTILVYRLSWDVDYCRNFEDCSRNFWELVQFIFIFSWNSIYFFFLFDYYWFFLKFFISLSLLLCWIFVPRIYFFYFWNFFFNIYLRFYFIFLFLESIFIWYIFVRYYFFFTNFIMIE